MNGYEFHSVHISRKELVIHTFHIFVFSLIKHVTDSRMVSKIICLDAHVIIQVVPVIFIMAFYGKQYFPEPQKMEYMCEYITYSQSCPDKVPTPFAMPSN